MKKLRSLRERAAEQAASAHVGVNVVVDVSKGRPFNPLTPQNDGLSRVMITRVPMMNSETGEEVFAYHVDYFNCENAQEAAHIYGEGVVAVNNMVKENARPEPL